MPPLPAAAAPLGVVTCEKWALRVSVRHSTSLPGTIRIERCSIGSESAAGMKTYLKLSPIAAELCARNRPRETAAGALLRQPPCIDRTEPPRRRRANFLETTTTSV